MGEPRADGRNLIPRGPDQEIVLLYAIPRLARSAVEQDLIADLLSERIGDPTLPGDRDTASCRRARKASGDSMGKEHVLGLIRYTNTNPRITPKINPDHIPTVTRVSPKLS